MGVYVSATDVAAMTQENSYTTTTVPTLAQVNAFIAQIEGQVETELYNAGYVVPVAATTEFPAVRALATVKLICTYLAASLAVQATDPVMQGDRTGGSSRAEQWQDAATGMLDNIRCGDLKLFDALKQTLVTPYKSEQLLSGSNENEGNPPALGGPDTPGQKRQPYFTRNQVF